MREGLFGRLFVSLILNLFFRFKIVGPMLPAPPPPSLPLPPPPMGQMPPAPSEIIPAMPEFPLTTTGEMVPPVPMMIEDKLQH